MRSSNFRIASGIVLLLIVIIVLVTNAKTILMQGITIIDTEIQQEGDDAHFVRTRMDFGSTKHMNTFPTEFEDWESIEEYDWSDIKKDLGGDMQLARAYTREDLYQPVFLTIARSDDVSSFHPPPVCYRAQGYKVEEKGKTVFPVDDNSWAYEQWRSIQEGNIFKGEISTNILIIYKETPQGGMTERRILLYYYVKDNRVVAEHMTTVQVSALAPVSLSYEDTIDLLRELMGNALPILFEPRDYQDDMISEKMVDSFGFFGWVLIVGALGTPFGIIFWPVIERRIPLVKKQS